MLVVQAARNSALQAIRCLNRIFVEAEELSADGARVSLPAHDYRAVHIREVLRLGGPGDCSGSEKVPASSSTGGVPLK